MVECLMLSKHGVRLSLGLCVLAVAACKSSTFPGRSPSGGETPTPVARPVKKAKGITAAPLVSRGRPTATSKRGAGGATVVDGKYKAGAWQAGLPTEAAPAWVAPKRSKLL
jgi:hypothetical protein